MRPALRQEPGRVTEGVAPVAQTLQRKAKPSNVVPIDARRRAIAAGNDRGPGPVEHALAAIDSALVAAVEADLTTACRRYGEGYPTGRATPEMMRQAAIVVRHVRSTLFGARVGEPSPESAADKLAAMSEIVSDMLPVPSSITRKLARVRDACEILLRAPADETLERSVASNVLGMLWVADARFRALSVADVISARRTELQKGHRAGAAALGAALANGVGIGGRTQKRDGATVRTKKITPAMVNRAHAEMRGKIHPLR